MLFVTTWFWGNKFHPDHVHKLREGVRRHLWQEHRFIVVQPAPVDQFLTEFRGCFVRLRMFDPQFQKDLGMEEGDRILNLDLDTVITGPLDPLLDRPEPLVIMQKGNAANPCPFNGAMIMLRAGAHPEVWSEFSLLAAQQVPYYEFPDDQGWIWNKVPDAAGWVCGPGTGVYVFKKPGWPGGDDLPKGARLVTFNGSRSPSNQTHLDWVRYNWT